MSPVNSTTPHCDSAQFLKIAGQAVGLSTHADLWRWLQGDVQLWLAHEVMLIGWGDFRCGALRFDIVSSLPGMRSHHWTTPAIAPLISYFRDCWVAAQQLPCQIELAAACELVPQPGPGPLARETFASLRTALVHGMAGGLNGEERVFAALSRQGSRGAGDTSALKVLLPFIDHALRRIPGPGPATRFPNGEGFGALVRPCALSGRERQIMEWVALGKTNPEIGCILSISEFTVKNHMKSIFGKLDVTNRAQAVAKLTRISVHA